MTDYAVTNPATGEVLATYPTATDAEVQAALAAAAEVRVLAPGFTDSCMEERDRWMVDQADRIIAVLNEARAMARIMETAKLPPEFAIPADSGKPNPAAWMWRFRAEATQAALSKRLKQTCNSAWTRTRASRLSSSPASTDRRCQA